MKTFKFPLVLRTRENTDVFITFDDNIYGIHSKRVNILSIYINRHHGGYTIQYIDYYIAIFISYPISTPDTHISLRAKDPRADVGRGLIWGMI